MSFCKKKINKLKNKHGFLKAMCSLGLFVTLCLLSLCDNPAGSINDEPEQPLMLQNPFVHK